MQQSPSRRDYIVRLAERLIRHLDVVDLNQIDGTFYWYVCQSPLLEQLMQSYSLIAPYFGPQERWKPYPRLSGFKERELFIENFEAYQAIGRQLPPHVVTKLAAEDPVPLRPQMSWLLDRERGALQFRVFSQATTGEDVEATIAPSRNFAFEGEVDWRKELLLPQNALHYGFAFSLITEPNHAADDPDAWWDGAPPYIEIMLRRPLPPAGVIGQEYDRVVREQKKWHLRLPGPTSGQEKATAIWTWAISLLITGGEDFYDARRVIGELIRSLLPKFKAGHSRSWFEKSRSKLIARVPEAKPYLYSREKRSKQGKNA